MPKQEEDEKCRSLGLKGVFILVATGLIVLGVSWLIYFLKQKKVSYFRTIILEYIYLFLYFY